MVKVALIYLKFSWTTKDIRTKNNADRSAVHLILMTMFYYLMQEAAQVLKKAKVRRRKRTDNAFNDRIQVSDMWITVLW